MAKRASNIGIDALTAAELGDDAETARFAVEAAPYEIGLAFAVAED